MTEPLQPEGADSDEEANFYVLHLFVAGVSLHSTRAVANLKHICESYIPGKYSLEIIDVHQQKALAEQEQLIALPLLIKRMPLPERRLVGDLSNTEKVLTGLGISRK